MSDQARGGSRDIPGDVKLLLGKKDAEDYHCEYWKRRAIWQCALEALVEKVSTRLEPLKHQGCKFFKPHGRVKEFDSLIRSAFAEYSKTGAKGTFDWNFILREVDDIVGLRIVTLNLGDITPGVRMVLSDEGFSWSRDRIKDFYKKGSKSGYRSWQIKMTWKSALADPPLRIEIQVRTILEDAWSEWEHNLFYKLPEGMSPSSWEELKILHAEQAEAISDSLYEAAQATERLRATFEIINHRPPEHVSTLLDRTVDQSLSHELLERVGQSPFSMRVVASSLQGLRPMQVHVCWARPRFVGLCLKESDTSEPVALGAADRCFSFEKLQRRSGEDALDVHLDDFSAGAQKAVRQSNFSRLAQDLLLQRFAVAGAGACRTFFNDYQARLESYDADSLIDTRRLVLSVSSTNFAFEACTTFVLDAAARNPKGLDGPAKNLLDVINGLKSALGEKKFVSGTIGVHVNVISCPPDSTKAPSLIVSRRGPRQAQHVGEWSTAVSGAMVPYAEGIGFGGDVPGLAYASTTESRTDGRTPCVFRAAQREVEEELGLHVPTNHLRLIALMFDMRSDQPVLVLEAYIEETLDGVRELWKDAQETWELDRLQAVPLTQEGMTELTHGMGDMPPLTQTKSVGGKSWQARSAVAVLMSLSRHIGSAKVQERLFEVLEHWRINSGETG